MGVAGFGGNEELEEVHHESRGALTGNSVEVQTAVVRGHTVSIPNEGHHSDGGRATRMKQQNEHDKTAKWRACS